jgi:hypothetical protein
MYAIKTEITEPSAHSWTFNSQKTMYGGKNIKIGDKIFIFASENEGGTGLVAIGTVSLADAISRKAGIERQAPRVSISVTRVRKAKRPLGRNDLKPFNTWNDGRPETELNFKFYRQATNKIVGLSIEAAEFLDTFF